MVAIGVDGYTECLLVELLIDFQPIFQIIPYLDILVHTACHYEWLPYTHIQSCYHISVETLNHIVEYLRILSGVSVDSGIACVDVDIAHTVVLVFLV